MRTPPLRNSTSNCSTTAGAITSGPLNTNLHLLGHYILIFVQEIHGRMDAKGKRVAIVVSRWNELVTKELLDGALSELKRLGDPAVEVVHVPGTWEIPPVVKGLLSRLEPNRPNAVIALGCILQGQTPHAKLLGGDVGGALMSLQVEFGIPIAWGVLTPDTQDQALDRAGLKLGNKGREAAQAAIETASVLEQL